MSEVEQYSLAGWSLHRWKILKGVLMEHGREQDSDSSIAPQAEPFSVLFTVSSLTLDLISQSHTNQQQLWWLLRIVSILLA